MPKGYWTDYYFVGYMHNGQKRYFVSEEEYLDAFKEEQKYYVQ